MLNKKAILTLVGLCGLPFAAKAKIKQDPHAGGETSHETQDIAKTCSQLIHLNGKNEISASEFYVGQKLYELIEQISTSPIDYCDEIQMAQVVEQEPL